MQNLFRTVPKFLKSPRFLPNLYSSIPKAPFTYVSSYPGREGSPLKLGQMTLDQFRICLEWAAKEGWYICEGDAEALYAADPSGFFGGDINGEFVCCYTGWKYDDYVFLSLHLVKDEFQAKGYGTEVEEYAKDFYKNVNSVSFDVAGERIKRFVKKGYKDLSEGSNYYKIAQGKLDKSLVDLRSIPIEQVDAYDLDVFGYRRTNYVKSFLDQKTNIGLGAFKDGKMCGYSILRKLKYSPGYAISPLMADDKETAYKLLDGLQSFIPGERVTVAIFHCNPLGIETMKEQGWTWNEYTFLRMFGGERPKIDMNRLLIPDTL